MVFIWHGLIFTVFNHFLATSYGNILIIKLSAALPLVLLGAYHQLRLHRSAVLVASLAQGRGRKGRGSTSSSSDNIATNSGSGKDPGIDNNAPVSQTFSNNYGGDINDKNNNNRLKDKGKIKDIPSRFSKTIKIESLLAMGVLLVASLLTITSPPAMNMGISSMAASMSSSSSSMSRYVDDSNEKQHIHHSDKNTECKYKARNQSILLRI